MTDGSLVPAPADPLFPAESLLPLSEPGGGLTPLPTVPGPLRPFSARLAVPAPAEGKKHDTTASRWTEKQATQHSVDSKLVPDSVNIVHTDS